VEGFNHGVNTQASGNVDKITRSDANESLHVLEAKKHERGLLKSTELPESLKIWRKRCTR
jgi:hypothetical protein